MLPIILKGLFVLLLCFTGFPPMKNERSRNIERWCEQQAQKQMLKKRNKARIEVERRERRSKSQRASRMKKIRAKIKERYVQNIIDIFWPL